MTTDTVRITRLDNGLTVVTDPMDHVATASVGAWVATGSRHERAAVNGVSHCLEHMAFKGTHRRDAQAIAEEIEDVGGFMNAYTSRESTAFYAKVLKEDVPLAVDIIADLINNATLDADELAREREVIVQEIHQADDTPDDVVFDHFQSTAYPDQPVGWPVMGSVEVVRNNLSRDVLADHLRNHYHPGRLVISAAGNVDHDHVVGLAKRHFADRPTATPAPYQPAGYTGGDYREARDLEQVHLILGFQGVGFRDPDFYSASVLSVLLGGGMSSRLFQELREKRGLAYTVHAFAAPFEDDGLFGVYAGTGEREAQELIPVMCDEIAGIADSVTDAEIERARAQFRAGLLMGLESTSNRCEQLARQMMVYGRPVPTDEMVANINAVDRDAVRRVARRLFATRPTLTALGPLGGVEGYDRLAGRFAA